MTIALIKQVVIGFSEPRLYISALVTILAFSLLIKLALKLEKEKRDQLTHFLGATFIFMSIITHPMMYFSENMEWSIHKALPLHLCALNFLLLGINCFIKKRALWEITAFMGIIGGVHSMITPQLPLGDGAYFYFEYYYKHGALLFIPIYFWLVYGFRFKKKAWLKLFLFANIYAVFAFSVNWTLNTLYPGKYIANYFYLWEPPIANSPLVMGGWPYYLIPFEIALFLHLLIINIVFRWREGVKPVWK